MYLSLRGHHVTKILLCVHSIVNNTKDYERMRDGSNEGWKTEDG